MTAYRASLRQNPGRRYLVVEFRHPLRPDAAAGGKPGRKVRKGVGTEDYGEAQAIVDQLNTLLADASLHSAAARTKAEARFDRRVVEMFYEGIEPKRPAYRALRDESLPLPSRDAGFPRVLLLGAPGAAKTTLVRQLIGAHPERDRFPSTSVNRTTTAETEVVIGEDHYSAVVTFMSEEEADFEVQQCVSNAVLRAAQSAPEEEIARSLLESSDMRFRLKYLLGDWPAAEADEDPYEVGGELPLGEVGPTLPEIEPADKLRLDERLKSYVDRIKTLAEKSRGEAESQARLETLSPEEERNVVLDRVQMIAEEADEFSALVSDILDEIRTRFLTVPTERLRKTTTGWPRLWRLTLPTANRDEFFEEVRYFAGIDKRQWGKLLTPLVNGIRVAGPFVPSWTPPGLKPRMVLIDTEGLGHKASAMPDVPDHIVSRFQECDLILFVHRGDVPFTFESGKALESIAAAGQIAKTAVVFSRMDSVRGENIRGWSAKRDYVFNGVRNVIENQLAKSLSPDSIRFMSNHLERNVFFLGALQEAEPRAAVRDLRALLTYIQAVAPAQTPAYAFPEYNFDLFVLSIQSGIEGFRLPWRAYLNLSRHDEIRPLAWQSIKAVSRRYAEGFDDGYELRPVSNLLNSMSLAIGRFLDNPTRWNGDPSEDDRRTVVDLIKSQVSKDLTIFCSERLRGRAQKEWQDAYACSGRGSTLDRRLRIEALYERLLPVPTAERSSLENVQELLNDLRKLVDAALDKVQSSLEPSENDV